MEATGWSDYLCPWCYLAQDRDRLLADLGVTVTHLPYELHPEIPPEGRRVRADGRLRPTHDRIEEACAEAGLPFRRPTRIANTRRALSTAEWVRRHQPPAFAAVHAGLFAAAFARDEPIDDPGVIDAVLTDAEAEAGEARAAVDGGRVEPWIDESMAAASRLGVAGTPAWAIGDLVIPGALDRETLTRWITRLQQRAPTPNP